MTRGTPNPATHQRASASAAEVSHAHSPTWETLSDPLAGFTLRLAERLASGPATRAAMVAIDRVSGDAGVAAGLLGEEYCGQVSRLQLMAWAGLPRSWWARHKTRLLGTTVEGHAIESVADRSLTNKDSAVLKQLDCAHALWLRCGVRGCELTACVLLGAINAAALDKQAEHAREVLPIIRSRLALIIAPPVILPAARPTLPLSKAERVIFPLLLERLTERAIAQQLDRSRNTIHTHVKSIYRKLGVRSRRELRKRHGAKR